jgi:hypothetical protein
LSHEIHNQRCRTTDLRIQLRHESDISAAV